MYKTFTFVIANNRFSEKYFVYYYYKLIIIIIQQILNKY